MSDPAQLLDMTWTALIRGKADRRHPARHPTLASIGPNGPEMRTLVLRGADRDTATLELHTDALSPKVAQIAADARVALHVWVPNQRLQIRARATAEILPGDPALFASLPDFAKANYAGPIPGATPDSDTPDTAAEARFTRIRCTLTEIDVLLLSEPHQRALFKGPDWEGQWIAA